MAVIAKWMCDRDGSMFDSKKDADAYDKMLELAEQFTSLFEKHLSGVDAQEAEALGILLAQNKDDVMNACKGKSEALENLGEEVAKDTENVTPIAANA